MEAWKDVVGYSGIYKVSSLGNVKSLRRVVLCSNGVQREIREKLIVPCKSTDGYLACKLCVVS